MSHCAPEATLKPKRFEFTPNPNPNPNPDPHPKPNPKRLFLPLRRLRYAICVVPNTDSLTRIQMYRIAVFKIRPEPESSGYQANYLTGTRYMKFNETVTINSNSI